MDFEIFHSKLNALMEFIQMCCRFPMSTDESSLVRASYLLMPVIPVQRHGLIMSLAEGIQGQKAYNGQSHRKWDITPYFYID